MSDTIKDPAEVAGPSGDGSNHLARESKWGLATGFVALAVVDGLIEGLNAVDMDGWTGWWARLATAGVATAIGALTAYRTRNRTGLTVRYKG